MNFFKNLIISVALVFFVSTYAVAHDGRHGQVLGKEEITMKSKRMIRTAVEKNKVDEYWLNAELVEINTKTVRNSDEWIVVFKTLDQSSKQKNLYLFFSLDGEFLAMNYTGK